MHMHASLYAWNHAHAYRLEVQVPTWPADAGLHQREGLHKTMQTATPTR